VKNNGFLPSEKIYSVSELTLLIKTQLEEAFPVIWVEGEISNFFRHQSGHLYFTIKDKKCQLRTVIFRSDASRIKFDLKDGLQIICRGRINVYEPRGEYQLMVDSVEPKGKGALQLAFEQLKIKLKEEGLFEPERKKPLPLLSKKVGIVTSPRGAAISDIIRTLERRFGGTHIVIYPVKVQGEGAWKEIVEGIDFMGQQADIDVLIVGRGGGSIEDLWAFNEEQVARAIFRCPIPVISAVGHEVDFTIADFVADVRASTPSAAAEMVMDKEQSFIERIDNLKRRLSHHLNFTLQIKKNEVASLVQHQAFHNFKVKLLNLGQKVDEWETRAWNHIKNLKQQIAENRSSAVLLEEKIMYLTKGMFRDLEGRWERLSVELNGLSPLNILKKGYSLCWKKKGEVFVRKIDEIQEEDEVTVSFFKGEFTCSVSSVDKNRTIQSRFLDKGKRSL